MALLSAAAGCGSTYVVPPQRPSAPANSDSQGFALAQQAITALDHAVDTDRPQDAAALEAPGNSLPAAIVSNAQLVGIHDLGLDYIADDPAADPTAHANFGDAAWVGTVRVSYHLPGDASSTTFPMDLTFTIHGSTARIVAAGGGTGTRGALWLEGPVQVRRTHHALLIVARGQSLSRFWSLATRAVQQVQAVLRPDHWPLIFEVAGSQQQFEQNMGASAGDYDLVAGVTGTVDGSTSPQAPLHSSFNPALFASETRVEGQIVVTHEAALQATRSPQAPMPLWMAEGFADYVAFRRSPITLKVAAQHVIAQTRRQGPPTHLPTQQDFHVTDTTLDQLNAVYESAWLACRYLATTYGQPVLLKVFDALERGTALNTALHRNVGLTQAQFVAAWRRYLVDLSGR